MTKVLQFYKKISKNVEVYQEVRIWYKNSNYTDTEKLWVCLSLRSSDFPSLLQTKQKQTKQRNFQETSWREGTVCLLFPMKLYTKEMGLYESHSTGNKPFPKKADKLLYKRNLWENYHSLSSNRANKEWMSDSESIRRLWFWIWIEFEGSILDLVCDGR